MARLVALLEWAEDSVRAMSMTFLVGLVLATWAYVLVGLVVPFMRRQPPRRAEEVKSP
jgi:hypothetical protein